MRINYDNLLIKYFGQINVFSNDPRNLNTQKQFYDVELKKNEDSEYFVSFIGKGKKLEFSNGLHLIDGGDLSSRLIGYVDIKLLPIKKNLTSLKMFEQQVSKISTMDVFRSDRIYHSFRSALTRKIKSDEYRISREVEFKKNETNLLQLEYNTENERMEVSFNEYQFKIEKKGPFWKINDPKIKLPAKGKLTIFDAEAHEIYNIFKLKVFRRILNDPPVPNSPVARFRCYLENMTLSSPTQSEIGFSTDQLADSQQKNLLSSLLNDPLILVDSIAGTGKTTTVLNALIQLVKNQKRVLVVTHSHRAVEAIIENLLKIDPELSSVILRLATKNTARTKVVHKQFLYENNIKHEQSKIIQELNEAIKDEDNEDVKKLQENVRSLFTKSQEGDLLSQLLTKSKLLVFGTADSLITQSYRFNNSKSSNLFVHPPEAEFDLVIVEDCSDINFPTLFHSIQFSKRWAIIGDKLQSNPIVSSSTQLPKYEDRQVPSNVENVEIVKNLNEEQHRMRSVKLHSKKIDDLLKNQGLELLKSNDYFKNPLPIQHLKTWYRMAPNMADFLIKCFPILEELVTTKKEPINILIPTFQVLDSNLNTRAETPYEGGGYTNEYEIELLQKWLTRFSNENKESCTVGIFAPFKIQVEKIKENLKQNGFQEAANAVLINRNYPIKIHVNTLHNHKNREYDLMIISATRSELRGQLKSKNDVFTIFSRAKQSLLLICDYPKYKKSWTNYKKSFKKKGLTNNLPWDFIFNYVESNPHSYINGESL